MSYRLRWLFAREIRMGQEFHPDPSANSQQNLYDIKQLLSLCVCVCVWGWNYSSILIPLANSQQNLYEIYLLLFVQCWTPDWHRNCPKHVEFCSKNKFQQLVHLVGFIIRIYHDARSSECQICLLRFSVLYSLILKFTYCPFSDVIQC